MISANVVSDLARTIIDDDKDSRHILKKNGRQFSAGDSWCQEVLHELGFSKRRCTTAASKLPTDWEHQGAKVTHQVLSRLFSMLDPCKHVSLLSTSNVMLCFALGYTCHCSFCGLSALHSCNNALQCSKEQLIVS